MSAEALQWRPSGLIVMRGDLDSNLVEWALSVERFEWIPGDRQEILLGGRVVSADFNDALDSRLTNQRAAIDRLQAHLDEHCSGMSSIFCSFANRSPDA